MTTFTEIALTLCVLLGLWWLYFCGYPALVADNTRQRLFRLRDALFEHAQAGEIDFNSPAYGMVRTTLNGMIRYTHEVSLVRLLVLRYGARRHGPDLESERYRDALNAAIADLAPPARKIVRSTLRTMHATIIKHVIYRSALLTIAYRIGGILRRPGSALAAWIWHGLRRQTLLNTIDSQANAIGSSHGCRSATV